MAKDLFSNNNPVPREAISQIQDEEDFIQFLRGELDWPIPLHIDRLEDVAIPHDLQRDFGFDPEEDRIQVSRLLNLSEDQPWGIFLFEFKTKRPYLTHLRRLLRFLGSQRTLRRGDPIWDRNDILFICTNDWRSYQFVHFSGEQAEGALISSFGWMGPEDRFLHTLCKHNLPKLRMPEPDAAGTFDADAWRTRWREAFNIKPVTDEFYATLKEVFQAVEAGVSGLKGEQRRAFTELLVNRLIFLKFVEKKGWLDNDPDYLYNQFKQYGSKRFWKDFLFYLFFEGMNTDPDQRSPEAQRILGEVPYLNAELFALSNDWDDRQVDVSNGSLDLLFDKLLNPYNFTISETSPLEVEVAFNQDLLGYAYEELIADQHGQGAYYTHPTEVNLMCRESLRAYLETRCPQVDQEQIGLLVYGEISLIGDQSPIPPEHAIAIYTALHDVTICDPAVGSGTFPVAMVKHIFTIMRTLGQILADHGPFQDLIDRESLTDWRKGYDLKLHIIERSIYGCDIDYFAVQIAKLRFWIELMVECEYPVSLPNFDFKLLIGDALVSATGVDRRGNPIYLENILGHPTQSRIHSFDTIHVQNFSKLKRQYFDAKNISERNVIREEINNARDSLLRNLGLSIPQEQRTDKHILWQIDFAEIFGNEFRGFDIVIANPPYLRQELLDNSFTTFKLAMTKSQLRDLYSTIYKPKISGMADIYVYFFIRGLMLLKQEDGIFCYICSNSWLDVNYGKELREIILRNCDIRFILENQVERSFESAAVNTTINLFITSKKSLKDNRSSFIVATKQLGILEKDKGFRRALVSHSTIIQENFRKITISNLNLDEKQDKWGAYYLKAPSIFHFVFEKLASYLIPINQIASVRRGLTTGCNEFFYLTNEQIENWGIEDKYLIPVCRGPRDVSTGLQIPSKLTYKIFYCHEIPSRLKGTNAWKYILWGEDQGYPDRPTLRARARWYDVGERPASQLCVNHRIHDRMRCYLNSFEMLIGDNFHELFNIDKNTAAALFISLNSNFIHLWVQSLGRVNFGDGLLEFKGYEIENILVLSPKLLIKREYLETVASLATGSEIEQIVETFDKFICEVTNINPNILRDVREAAQTLVDFRLTKAHSYSG